ncbi:hypothetical protein [Cohnella fermenti]|uniref:DUF559 domain-containing protein n=1 Tax=Cohnella fermenti TaxID=2565925 RepID=A0A4S4BHK9_9BACL|nr:hypothetical protein [Cohnella fermenti]THF73998.1 hypothetical protein E6C55_26840 [Cohnella fermenti]
MVVGTGAGFGAGAGTGAGFEAAHGQFIQAHLEKRKGERRGRLERGHREAEKLFCKNVWWPLRGSFEGLHPEYEVFDWRGMSFFCDFAWITGQVKLVIEIKGFGPHVRDMDRKKYSNELNRETFLTAMGHIVISFSYDDVADRPELCRTLLRMVLSRFQTEAGEAEGKRASITEKEIVRLAHTLARAVRPIDVVRHLGVNQRSAVKYLNSLCERGLFSPIRASGSDRIMKYELRENSAEKLWR